MILYGFRLISHTPYRLMKTDITNGFYSLFRRIFWTKYLNRKMNSGTFFSIPRIIHMSENERKKISRYCNLILEEDWAKDKFHTHSIRSLLSLLIVQTFRLVKNNTEVISNTSRPNETLTTILRYIDKRYDVNITLPRLATQVHMTPNYISHLFRKHLDTTLTSYLLNIRISKARDFLSNTNLTITDIAQKCGFNSLNHFCKSFKKIMGVSPTAFREICK